MTLTKNTDQIASAVALFLEQYKDKPKIAALLGAYMEQIQDLEEMFFDLLDSVNLDSAEGVQLDGLGEIVGLERLGRDDETYRRFLKARILSNRSSGTIEEIIGVIVAVSEAGASFEVSESFPAALLVKYFDAILEDSIASFDDITFANATGGRLLVLPSASPHTPSFVTDILIILNQTRAAGVKLQFIWSSYGPAETFTLSSSSGSLDTSSAKGLANAAQTTGGHLKGVV